MDRPRLLVIEDDDFTRTSIVGALIGHGMDIVDAVGTSTDAIVSFEKYLPNAVLLDLDLGYGPTGLDLAKVFRLRNPAVGLIMLTSFADPRLLRSNLPAIPPGTQYLVKNNVTEINIVALAVGAAIAFSEKSMLSQTRNDIPREIQGMTDIQIETLRLVAQGHTNNEIARQRFVSEKAVEQTIAKIAKALDIPGATNQNQRVHIARVYFRLTGQGHV